MKKNKIPSFEQLRQKSGDDAGKILNLYKGWDKSARSKDFEECERIERRIQETHRKHGIQES